MPEHFRIEGEHGVTAQVARVGDAVSVGNSTASQFVPVLLTPAKARLLAAEIVLAANEIDSEQERAGSD